MTFVRDIIVGKSLVTYFRFQVIMENKSSWMPPFDWLIQGINIYACIYTQKTVTCWCHGSLWMGCTGARNSAPRVADRKRRRLTAEEEREVTTRAFSACVRPLEMVTSFKYLVQVISSADDYWPAVVKNLSRASKLLSSMSRIFSREGAAPRVSGFFLRPWSIWGLIL